MTFVVGMHCQDGLVICADSQEGDGLNKREVEKIDYWELKGRWGLALGCAGNTPVITKLSDRVKTLLGQEAHTRVDIEEVLEGSVKYIREGYPEERLSLVAALWTENPKETRLYKIPETGHCLSVEHDFACVGMDSSLGYAALESIHDADLMPIDEGIRLAIFCTALMKKYSDGVGGRTWVYSYRNGALQWEYQPAIKTKEIEDRYALEGAGSLRSILWEYWQRKEGKA